MAAVLARKRTFDEASAVDEKLQHEEEESTDIKLAMLASLSACDDADILLDALLASEGNVERACELLRGPSSQREDASPRKKRSVSAPGYQATLNTFNIGGKAAPLKKQLTKKGQTLHLFAPEDIAAHTPCSIIHNFLPRDQADALLHELLNEAPTYGKDSFKMFDRTVTSPHTICFYVNDWEEANRQKNEYSYNGSSVQDVRATPKEMRRVSSVVKEAVNKEINQRIQTHYPGRKKLKYQSAQEWTPNTALVNVYDGGKESVGYHSDQLTYLGPRAVIGSLSLGVAREFRVRRIVPRDTQYDPKDETAKRANDQRADTEGQIAIHLPHNSLLVMHAEMQEEWKHSIAPAQTIDPHPIAKNKRINVTYRCYRQSLHPSKIPKCRCGVSTALRCVMKAEQNRGKYIWHCVRGSTPGEDGCDFFVWANFDDDGEPLWVTKDPTTVGER